MATPRTRHAAVALLDGRVLVVGGTTDGVTPLASTELYDPASATFAAGPTLTTARTEPSATLLVDGRVLVAGGDAADGTTDGAELFDPDTDGFVRPRR